MATVTKQPASSASDTMRPNILRYLLNHSHIEHLEPRLQFSIQYGVAASGDPAVTGVLATSGPGLKDLGAGAVRLFTDTSFLSSDFGVTASGKIFVKKPALVTVLEYAKGISQCRHRCDASGIQLMWITRWSMAAR